ECYVWTDSTITVSWIQALASKWKTFVCNRVLEFKRNADPLRWRHYSEKVNPTDMLTRGVPASNLTFSKVWWQGPQWLSRSLDFLPQRRETNDEVPDADSELRGKSTVLHNKTTVQEPLLVITRYCKRRKAMRVTVWIIRSVTNLQSKGPREAERYWTKHIQEESNSEEKARFVAGGCLRSSLRIGDLHPFFDEDGVIRIETRLQNASAPDETKFPVLLAGDNCFMELLVEHADVRLLHGGVSALQGCERATECKTTGQTLDGVCKLDSGTGSFSECLVYVVGVVFFMTRRERNGESLGGRLGYVTTLRTARHDARTFQCGLVVDPACPWFSTSPDRLVWDPEEVNPHGILEVKCPYSVKDTATPPTADGLCLVKNDSGTLSLHREPEYYYQVLGQLAGSYSNARLGDHRFSTTHRSFPPCGKRSLKLTRSAQGEPRRRAPANGTEAENPLALLRSFGTGETRCRPDVLLPTGSDLLFTTYCCRFRDFLLGKGFAFANANTLGTAPCFKKRRSSSTFGQ
ncbi:hypothetical protein HPB47_010597, partial [Ixodes persulcatus]